MKFSSQLDARQFLVNKITIAAGRSGVALSDAELRLLLLNLDEPESATGIPVEVLEDEKGTHENKIRALLQSAYSSDANDPEEQQKYKDAARALKNSDHYIRIIVAATVPRRSWIGHAAVYIFIALAMAGMILILQMWTRKQ
ncbi:MAG TPA: hypothetical protein VI636_07415 [Candidatus Angelobacter sp.]